LLHLKLVKLQKRHRLCSRGFICLALVAVYAWPSLYNGQPFFYPDTTAYIRGADAGFSRLVHRTTVWSDKGDQLAITGISGKGKITQIRKPLSSVPDRAVLAGRSIYYGGLLYLSHISGALWPAVLVQASAVLLAISMTLRTFGLLTLLRLSVISFVLATLTPLPFFVSFLEPDIFAGITILAISNLLVQGSLMPFWMISAWIALLSTALLFHVSHLLITVIMLVVGVSFTRLARVSIAWKGIVGIVVALTIASVGEVVFRFGVTMLVGAAPIRPPFLMARMIADGPGYAYLVASCPVSQLAVCRFANRLPVNSQDFMWSTDPAKGVFALADPDIRRRLGNEQYRFARETLAFDPLGVLAASLRHTAKQARLISLAEFNYSNDEKKFLTAHVPKPYLEKLSTTRAWKETVPTKVVSVAVALTTLLSLLYLTALALVWRRSFVNQKRLVTFIKITVVGTIINAAVCGTLSVPLDRYQARVIWLLPLAAMLCSLKVAVNSVRCQE
jgi:hypothetical protein